MLKHFLTNNFEHARTGFARLDGGSPTVNVVVSERALREFCLPPFKAAIEAGAGSLMGCASTSSSVTFSSPLLLADDHIGELGRSDTGTTFAKPRTGLSTVVKTR